MWVDISQEISSLLKVLFKKVILKISSFAAILYENNDNFFSILKCMLNKPSKNIFYSFYYTPEKKSSNLDLFSSARVVLPLKGQHQCTFFIKSVFFGLKFSLNLLEYEVKGFMHEKKKFLFNFAFFLRHIDRLSYSTQNFKRVFVETLFSKRHAP